LISEDRDKSDALGWRKRASLYRRELIDMAHKCENILKSHTTNFRMRLLVRMNCGMINCDDGVRRPIAGGGGSGDPEMAGEQLGLSQPPPRSNVEPIESIGG
jgi:hypothetical protein